MRRLWVWIATACFTGMVMPVLADSPQAPVADRVSFQVEAASEVENDQVLAILGISAEDKEPAQLADTINRTMRWALEQARAIPQVKSSSGSYQTHPVYDNRKIVNWRGHQDVHLVSQDVEQISWLIGVLQGRLQMQSLRFSVSPERRSTTEEALIEQALSAFQKRALLISKAFGARGYRLLNVSLTSGGRESVVPMRAELAMASRAQVSEPALEGGTSRITVQASGSIQLLRD